MQVKIVFENSGDEIVFNSVNPEVVEFYIDNLNNINANHFGIGREFKVPTFVNELHKSICVLNGAVFKFIDQELPIVTELDYLDQNLLNQLHYRFVKFQDYEINVQDLRRHSDYSIANAAETLHHMLPDDIKIISFGELLSKLELDREFDKLNLSIHRLEENFKLFFKTSTWTEFSNPFPKSILTNDVAHLTLSFNHLGRTLYNKYKNFDTHLVHQDENSYNQLLGFVGIELSPAETIPLSKEYCDWCESVGRTPIGDRLNIGIIPDLSNNLTKYRQLLYKNLKIQNKFSIHKG